MTGRIVQRYAWTVEPMCRWRSYHTAGYGEPWTIPPDHIQCMCNVDGFDMLYLDWIGHPLKWHQLFHHCVFREYTVVGRRCPAHPASVPILHLTDTRTLWSQQFEKEIPGTTLQLYKQNKQCNAMPSYWILKRSPYAHQQPTCIDREKNDAQRWKQRRANKTWKKQKNDKKPKHGEICTYVPRRSK